MNYFNQKMNQIITPETQLSGIRDCHVRGLHSVVLRVSPSGFLTRIYLADSNHELHHNERPNPKMTLGIHGHRTGIRITGLVGQMDNVLYQDTPSDFQAYQIEKCTFDSKIKGGEGALQRGPITSLWQTGVVNRITPWSRTWMNASELHTVYVRANQQAAWLIEEYEADRPHDPSCYTMNPEYCSNGIYTPMRHEESLGVLRDFGYIPQNTNL